MEALSPIVSFTTDLVSHAYVMIVSNPVLAAFTACGLLTAALGLFAAAKNSAR